MKRVFLLILLALPFMALADGWEYDNDKAFLVSIPHYFYDDGTCLGMMVSNTKSGDVVFLYLYGEIVDFDFRPRQDYVVVSFFDHKKSTRWKIKEINVNDHPFITIVDSANFIKRLRNSQTIEVTLPVYGQGTQIFTFSAYGYPLDW